MRITFDQLANAVNMHFAARACDERIRALTRNRLRAKAWFDAELVCALTRMDAFDWAVLTKESDPISFCCEVNLARTDPGLTPDEMALAAHAIFADAEARRAEHVSPQGGVEKVRIGTEAFLIGKTQGRSAIFTHRAYAEALVRLATGIPSGGRRVGERPASYVSRVCLRGSAQARESHRAGRTAGGYAPKSPAARRSEAVFDEVDRKGRPDDTALAGL